MSAVANQNRRKKRTRQHIIADLSFHHLATILVKAGYTIDAPKSDYGYDLTVYTFDDAGEYENGNLFVQLKATDRLKILKNGTISFSLDRRDIDTWEDEPFPVYLVVFDAVREQAYSLDLQPYLRARAISAATLETATRAVHLEPIVVSTDIVRQWRERKNAVLAQLKAIPR